MPRKKRGPKPKSETEKEKEKEKGDESEQSELEKAKATTTNNKPDNSEPVKWPFPIKRPRGRPSKKWQEQLALAIAEGRAVPFEKKPKKKKEAGKAEKKEKGTTKKDKKENKAPKTPKKDKKEKEDILEAKPATPNSQATKTTEKEPVSSQDAVEAAPPPAKKKPSISYLEILQAVLDKLYEYKWPQDETGEYFLLEQQLSDFVGVSLQAKHQDLEFHTVVEEEKEFLNEKKIINDGQQSKGVLAIKTDDAAILVMEHYPNKYQDFLQLAHKREKYKLLKKIEDEKTIKEGKKIPNPLKRALKDVVDFNAQLALQRREERCSYFDMQTQIIHYPVNKMSKLPNHMTVPSKYPVALLPGQFQEYYKSYSPIMMRSFPLGTVIDSSRHNQTCDSRSSLTGGSSGSSEESSSSSSSEEDDSDDDDDDDSSVSEASGDEKMSENEEEEVSEPPAKRRALGYKPPHRPDALCGICLKGRESNKKGLMEELIHCSQCENSGHPSCLDMSPQLVKVIITYPWQCMECKTCTQCRDPFDEDKMLFCDECDRGYHSFCVGLKQIPVGRWTCELCGVCASCLRRTPGEGPNSRWKSEYTKPRDKSEPQFLQTLCSPCSRLFRSGNFCPVCLKVYRNDESDLPMVCCDECDRWIHTDCDDIDEKSYAELSKEKTQYRCILCRGEKEERMDSFARKNREVSQDE